MADFILITGDLVTFVPIFGPAVVAVRPGQLRGSGPNTCGGKKICVAGDESKVSVPGCTYLTPAFPIPGIGTLKIDRLGGDQTATKTQSGGKAVLLKGAVFTARFDVQQPAMDALSIVPDPMPQYPGSGMFQSTNVKYRGT